MWKFYDKKSVVFSLTSFGALKYDFVIKTKKINFLPLLNNSFTILLSFLLFYIQQSYHQI